MYICCLIKKQQRPRKRWQHIFAEEAVVHDEGKVYRGLADIKEWNEITSKKYALTLEVISVPKKMAKLLLLPRHLEILREVRLPLIFISQSKTKRSLLFAADR